MFSLRETNKNSHIYNLKMYTLLLIKGEGEVKLILLIVDDNHMKLSNNFNETRQGTHGSKPNKT